MGKQNKKQKVEKPNVTVSAHAISELGKQIQLVLLTGRVMEYNLQGLLAIGVCPELYKSDIGTVRRAITALKNNMHKNLQSTPGGNESVRLIEEDLSSDKVHDLNCILELANMIDNTNGIVAALNNLVTAAKNNGGKIPDDYGREISKTV